MKSGPPRVTLHHCMRCGGAYFTRHVRCPGEAIPAVGLIRKGSFAINGELSIALGVAVVLTFHRRNVTQEARTSSCSISAVIC